MAQPAVTSSTNGSGGPPLTSAAAVESLTASLLSSSAAPVEEPKRGPGRPRKSEIEAAPETAAADETSEEAPPLPEGEDEDDEEEAGSEGESEEGADDQGDEERYEVQVDGRTLRVTHDELVKGYSREADYRHKTQRVAEDRKALDAARNEAQEELARRSQQLDQFLGYAMTADPILAEAQQVDWEKLSQDDPTKYVQLKAALEKRAGLYQAWQSHQQAQQQSNVAQVLTHEHAALIEKIPEAANRETWANEEKAITAYLKTSGLHDREIAGLWDHRIVVMARKAMKWDQMQAGKTVAQKKVAHVPKVVRPGSAQPRSTESSRTQELRSKFTKTRTSRDAVALLESQLLGSR